MSHKARCGRQKSPCSRSPWTANARATVVVASLLARCAAGRGEGPRACTGSASTSGSARLMALNPMWATWRDSRQRRRPKAWTVAATSAAVWATRARDARAVRTDQVAPGWRHPQSGGARGVETRVAAALLTGASGDALDMSETRRGGSGGHFVDLAAEVEAIAPVVEVDPFRGTGVRNGA